jgi:ribosome biogenesis GTPase
VVILNKSDLCDRVPERMAQTSHVAKEAPVIPCSARNGEGLEALAGFTGHGRTLALLGSSGVGKSTLVNCLLGNARQRTGEVRESDSRGRHITSHRELIPLPGGGALIDTPGMRELQLWAGSESVEQTFDEIARLAAGCRYRDCGHRGEPGCAVASALEDGSLAADRWQSYRKLLGEAHRHELMAGGLAAREEKRKLKVMFRAHRARMKSERR